MFESQRSCASESVCVECLCCQSALPSLALCPLFALLVVFTLRVSAARQNRDGFSRAAHPQLLKVQMHDGRSQILALNAEKYGVVLCTDSRESFLHSPHAAHELIVAPPLLCSARSRETTRLRVAKSAILGYSVRLTIIRF